jgi:hypothetical protein
MQSNQKGGVMSESDEHAREAPQSLAPIQLEGSRDSQEIAQMRGRRGLRLTIAGIVALAALAGGAQLLQSMDTRQAYANASVQLEKSDADQREAFTRCALPNQQRSQLGAPNALQDALELTSERMGKSYAKLLAKCTPLLETFQASVKAIPAPPEAKSRVDAVTNATDEFAKAWLGFKDYLQRPGEAYETEQAAPFIAKIASAWQEYQSARNQAKATLSAAL